MITQTQLDQVGDWLARSALGAEAIDRLRHLYPALHFTYCMDDDVCGACPVLRREGFNLYLIDSRNPCLAFTQDRQIASGILVAEVEQEP